MKDPEITNVIKSIVNKSSEALGLFVPDAVLPPDREFMREIIGTKKHLDAEGIGDLEFYFDEDGIVNYVDYDGLPVATPKTRLEVIMLVWFLWYGCK